MDNAYYTTIGMDVSDRTTKVCVMGCNEFFLQKNHLAS